jgi:hypothetical protein
VALRLRQDSPHGYLIIGNLGMDNCKPWIGCSCQRMSAANKYIEERPKLEPKSGAMEKSRKSIALIEYFVIPA